MSHQPAAYTRGKFLTAILLTAIVVGSTTFLTTYLLSSRVASSGTPATSAHEVSNSFVAHLQLLQSNNVSAADQEYLDNATLVWRGTIPPIRTQTFNGRGNISVQWCHMFCESAPYVFANVTDTVGASGNRAFVNASFDLAPTRESSINCNLRPPLPEAPINAVVTYAHSGEKWLISDETWNFQFVQWPVCSTLGR